MTNITVLCEPEHLPRVRLLQSHMGELGITLDLVEKAAPACERLLLIPRRTNSRLADTAATGNAERIVLYLDENPDPIPADASFTIPAWPARSSDADVERLAQALATPLREDTATVKPVDRTNQIALGIFALLAAALFAAVQLSGEKADDTPATEDAQLTTTAPAAQRSTSTSRPDASRPAAAGGDEAAPLPRASLRESGNAVRQSATAAHENARISGDEGDRAVNSVQVRAGSASVPSTDIVLAADAALVNSSRKAPAHSGSLAGYARQMQRCARRQSWRMEIPLICETLFDESEQRFR